ncbi:repressor phrH2 [Halarchaeum sp. CBA1220]|nr:repressor phrH2 [Halarchaeum sp. CBA1220]
MTTTDEYILEALDRDDYATVTTITRTINHFAPPRRVRERLRVLAQAGYVEPDQPDRTNYSLTVWGQLYLDGEVRPDLLVPEPSEERPGYVLG